MLLQSTVAMRIQQKRNNKNPPYFLTPVSQHRFSTPAKSAESKLLSLGRVIEREENDYNIIVGRRGFEPPGPAMSRRYPNQARPPAQYTMKKFVAQIYVVDRV
jgi:hypothetical protein